MAHRWVPTSRRRHARKETEPAQAALRSAREVDAGLRRRLANRVRAGETLIDPGAADRVRTSGWARDEP
jgi:hypothetical protein